MHNQSTLYRKELSGGTLTVTSTEGILPLEFLFDIAERRNPKRSFLFVSKVLGKHIPVSPQIMRSAYQQLARQIPATLPEPILFIGMAETAVGLGAGVYHEAAKRFNETVYLTSTRHPVDGELMCEFKEDHSHATDHLLYHPACSVLRACAHNARSVVLIDDEATTGKTFINLLAALRTRAGLSAIEHVVTVTLTDWSGSALSEQCPLPVTSVSLVKGGWQWEKKTGAPVPVMPDVNVTAKGSVPISGKQSWGRLGMAKPANDLGPGMTVEPKEKILVLGTGEFVWEPFLLAERLEAEGAEVRFSSTTRSPISTGFAIESGISFADNYGLGIPNFVYNVAHQRFDRILLCIETPPESVCPVLLDALSTVAPIVEVIAYE
ncbi:phosphoribosyltransferase domain-containing protein [uncultured Cedecea sp.]|uniref:phosphoribosyltransferase domain-containing protein n=1 Tax=uncultured Cedecea sp. TaxID=988762 RepID=UPI00261D54A1|nr:phosphoribosyltransferase domain-containing protein [uncultured Cedecea sp.]